MLMYFYLQRKKSETIGRKLKAYTRKNTNNSTNKKLDQQKIVNILLGQVT